eukprot:3346163-Heterocapsa_arctica.AAC.1
MHPITQQVCKARMYTRRSEIQQIEHEKHEDRNNTGRHRQTLIGEEQTKHSHEQEQDKLGPEENVSSMRDCTARRKHDEKTKRKMADCTNMRRRMEQYSLVQICQAHNSMLNSC